ncbi:MAG TPA: hypothetical protein VN229_10205 [Terriglobales bacterium]|nr:hypothetical protein [Terriglobales bacterium]
MLVLAALRQVARRPLWFLGPFIVLGAFHVWGALGFFGASFACLTVNVLVEPRLQELATQKRFRQQINHDELG